MGREKGSAMSDAGNNVERQTDNHEYTPVDAKCCSPESEQRPMSARMVVMGPTGRVVNVIVVVVVVVVVRLLIIFRQGGIPI